MVDETDFLATCLSCDNLLSFERIYKHGIVYAHKYRKNLKTGCRWTINAPFTTENPLFGTFGHLV
jgi:hypothetical protein